MRDQRGRNIERFCWARAALICQEREEEFGGHREQRFAVALGGGEHQQGYDLVVRPLGLADTEAARLGQLFHPDAAVPQEFDDCLLPEGDVLGHGHVGCPARGVVDGPTNRVGVPFRPVEQVLHAVRSGIARVLGQGPAGLLGRSDSSQETNRRTRRDGVQLVRTGRRSGSSVLRMSPASGRALRRRPRPPRDHWLSTQHPMIYGGLGRHRSQ